MSDHRHIIDTRGNGFVVRKSPKRIAKEQREARILAHIEKPLQNPSIKDVYQLQLDIAARLSELYDLIREGAQK